MSTRAFANKLRALRRRKGISQEELARLIGCDRATIAQWEDGISVPWVSMIPSIAAGLDLSDEEKDDLIETALYSTQLPQTMFSEGTTTYEAIPKFVI